MLVSEYFNVIEYKRFFQRRVGTIEFPRAREAALIPCFNVVQTLSRDRVTFNHSCP